VIAAGWAVGDEQAMAFATTFYSAILDGQRFLDAVGLARLAAQIKGGNTWAAYQCYGDPDWRFHSGSADAQAPLRPVAEEFTGIASPADLIVALTALAVQSEYGKAPRERQLEKIRHLQERFGQRWRSDGAVGEAFGRAFAGVNETEDAMQWYKDALAANDGGASIKAAEQLGNIRVRTAWEKVAKIARPTNGNDSDTSFIQEVDKARTDIAAGLKLLESIAGIQPSVERQSLCGSAWKRMALIERIAGRTKEERESIEKMHTFYLAAENKARETNDAGLFYPAMNRMAAEIIINAGNAGWQGLNPAQLAEVRNNLATKSRNNPDFWSIAGLVELDLYEALAQTGSGDLPKALPGLQRGYDDLYSRVTSTRLWSSVYDQARFILEPYSATATAAAQDAATKLLTLLRDMSSGTYGAQSRGATAFVNS
jgi:hypothetical protein